jgi:hypothetical protein
LLSVAELEDRVLDVAQMDARIVEEERDGRGGVRKGRMLEEMDEEGAEDVARHSLRAGLLLLAAFALRNELFIWLRDLDLTIQQATRG